ncbi:MAG: hypothetical protein KDJ26_03155 [Alphaproteobacteria bacterium]|nr:hypothetical protein [Alphaproteobacteria bacterium]
MKASDLKAIFASSKAFLHTIDKKNVPIQSTKKSDLLKFKKVICAKCNNSATQEFDYAWEEFSDYFRNNLIQFDGKKIKKAKIFPLNSRDNMKYVHLYWLKILGCYLASNYSEFDLEEIRGSLNRKKYNKKFFLCFFGRATKIDRRIGALVSDLNLYNYPDKSFALETVFVIDCLSIQLVYSDKEIPRILEGMWHPAWTRGNITLNNGELVFGDGW